ncbi:MAG: redoxin domain-containing protein [Chloroflexi bacterium]|nr:MAG: redoxin domain-containing protein [Chloroflexota bacterium]
MTDRPAFTHRPRRRGLVGPFSGRQLMLAAGSVVVAVLVIVGATTPLGPNRAGLPDPQATAVAIGPAVPGLSIGSLAPELSRALPDGTTYQLTDLDGHPVRLADLRGKGVWLNFWASWCPPCQQETPTLREVADLYRDRGIVLVAVDVQETVAVARSYADRYALRYIIGADVAGQVFRTYRVYALPTQFFIGPDGVIRSVVQGPLSRAGAIAHVEQIVPGATGSAAPSQSGS